jgi:hypothetical protein
MLDALHWLELQAVWFIIAAAVLAGLAYVWLTVRACGSSWWWIIPPAPLFYPLARMRRARGPLLLALFAGVVVAVPWTANRIINLLPREPWDKLVEGKRHISLTNWGRKDYAILLETSDADAVYMANPDVTDETLDLLYNHKLVTELDLSNTQITDAGLAKLKNLASLKKIWLVNTKITDQGFREHLMPRDWIESIDVTGTDIKGSTLRQWEQARPNRSYVN